MGLELKFNAVHRERTVPTLAPKQATALHDPIGVLLTLVGLPKLDHLNS